MSSLANWPLLSDPAIVAIFAALDGESDATRIVGGAVREALLKRPGSSLEETDADFATIFQPTEIVARAGRAGLKTVPTGIDHGTVTIIHDGKPFEVTTLRRDIETDGRHAVVSFTRDWRVDAARRDFTINAIYCNAAGKIFDPWDGIADLGAGRIRFIGEAGDRISEDYLRILRFFRFFARYGHGRPDAEGLKACARLKAGLATLSAERVWAELKRIFGAADPTRALLWMRTTEVLQKVLPESWGIDAVHRLVAAEKSEGWPADALLRLESILPPHRARIDALAERLRLSRAEAARLHAWADTPEIGPATSEAKLQRLLYLHGEPAFADRVRHVLAREVEEGHADAAGALRALLRNAANWQRPVFPVSGKDLVDRGLEPGPAIGRRLKEMEQRWLESGFTLTREALLGLT